MKITLDLTPFAVDVFRSSALREAFTEFAEPMVERAVRKVMAEREAKAVTCQELRGGSADSNRKFEARNEALRALSIMTRNRRRYYRRHELEEFLRGAK